MNLKQLLKLASPGLIATSVSPACKAPADRGNAAGCQILGRSAPGPCPGGLIQLLDEWAAAPWGDCVAGGRAEVASEVRSTGTAGRGPACRCRLVHFCSTYTHGVLISSSKPSKSRLVCGATYLTDISRRYHSIMCETSSGLSLVWTIIHMLWCAYVWICQYWLITADSGVMSYLAWGALCRWFWNACSEVIGWRVQGLCCSHANLSAACWMKSSISSSRAGQQSTRFSRAVMYGWGLLLQNNGTE